MRPGRFGVEAECHQRRIFHFSEPAAHPYQVAHWEHGGFVLYYKRLEQGTFPVPSKEQLGWAELVLMIEGIQVQKSRQLPRYQL